jgi:hypothetical protein
MALNTYLGGFLLTVAAGVVAVLGLLLVRKVVHFEKLKPSHEVGGYLIAVVGALYAVLLGLIVVDAMQQYWKAREITESEVNNLADVYVLAGKLPEPTRSQVRKDCTDYAQQVVTTEWKQMNHGLYCPLARGKAIHLMQELVDFEPQTDSQRTLYSTMINDASTFWQNRQSRISIAQNGVPAVEWIVLVLGAAITVAFTYFFGLQNVKLQIIMTAMVAMLIALSLILLLLFAYPFSGDLCVQDEPFANLQELFQSITKPAAESH